MNVNIVRLTPVVNELRRTNALLERIAVALEPKKASDDGEKETVSYSDPIREWIAERAQQLGISVEEAERELGIEK